MGCSYCIVLYCLYGIVFIVLHFRECGSKIKKSVKSGGILGKMLKDFNIIKIPFFEGRMVLCGKLCQNTLVSICLGFCY